MSHRAGKKMSRASWNPASCIGAVSIANFEPPNLATLGDGWVHNHRTEERGWGVMATPSPKP
jgi:hypothetical protein